MDSLNFERTLQAITEYYDARKAGPQSFPGVVYVGYQMKSWERLCSSLAFEAKEAFWKESGGKCSRDECLAMRVENIQALISAKSEMPEE